MLFYREFRRFTGGDLKVWDYFNHVLSTPGWEPYVRFYGCAEDLSNESPDAALPDQVIAGTEPFIILGAMAGG